MTRGNPQRAVRDAMLGLQNCPNGSNGMWYRLAAVHLLRTGRHEASKSILEPGLKVFPDDIELNKVKKLIN